MYAPWKSLITQKELLNEEEENTKWQEHTLLLSLAAVDLQNGKSSSRDVGGHIYRPSKGGYTLEKFPWKVVPSDEPMVPPAKASDHPVTHRRWYSRWTKWPSQCTDALHRCLFRPFGAEEHPLGAVLYSLNTSVEWTAELNLKHRFIRAEALLLARLCMIWM
jgi:hypothetical protein